MRICSLLPSATEIVFAVGLGDRLVAVTHECDYPPEALRLPVVTRSTIGAGDDRSRDIHRHVTEAAHRGSSLYALDQELIARLDPDLILTQELCDVCAVSYTAVEQVTRRLEGARTIVSLEPRTLDGILETIVDVGQAAGAGEGAAALVLELRERIERVRSVAVRATERPRVFAMEWLDPPFTAGHWVPEMIRFAGGHDDLGRQGGSSYEIAWSDVAKFDPEIVVLTPCSFHLDRTLEEFARVPLPAEWRRLTAVESGRVYAVDSAAYFSRSGPRAIDGLEILAEIIHPELFPRRAPSDAWQRLGRVRG